MTIIDDSGDTAPDPFDPKSLKLSQDFAVDIGVKRHLTSIPVRRPDKQWFVRTHPEHRLCAAVIELRDEKETYIVVPSLSAELAGETNPKLLVLSITRQGLPFFWPIKVPGIDGKIDTWNQSAMAAAEQAVKFWVRVTANFHAGAYDVDVATGNIPDPVWPEQSMTELLKLAFRDKLIDRMDHPVIQRLRGAI